MVGYLERRKLPCVLEKEDGAIVLQFMDCHQSSLN